MELKLTMNLFNDVNLFLRQYSMIHIGLIISQNEGPCDRIFNLSESFIFIRSIDHIESILIARQMHVMFEELLFPDHRLIRPHVIRHIHHQHV